MVDLFHCVGTIVVALLVLYIVGAFIPRKKPSPAPSRITMPVLRPVPISTKSHDPFMRILVWLYEPREWELVSDWQYTLPSGDIIILTKGFRFDAASVPRPLWAWLNPSGLLLIPGLMHDYGYRYQQLWKINTASGTVSPHMKGAKKAVWDRLLLDVGKQVNGTKVINYAAYLVVCIFGGRAWKKNRKNRKKAIPPVLLHCFPLP